MGTFGKVREVVPNLPKCGVRVWKSYRTYLSIGYGYACFTKLTKVSDMVQLLARIRTPGISTKPYPVPGYFCRGRTELTKVSGTCCMDVVPNLPKGRVRVWMFYQAYQRVGYGTAACTCTRTRPRVFRQGRTRYQNIFPRAYRTYQSVGYGCGSRTKLTKVLSTGNARGTFPLYTVVRALPYTP